MSKTMMLLEALKVAPMKRGAAKQLINSDSVLTTLVKQGRIIEYRDINPDYASGLPGQKPICIWLKIGDPAGWVRKRRGRPRGQHSIMNAITILEAAGYTITPPND